MYDVELRRLETRCDLVGQITTISMLQSKIDINENLKIFS